MTMSKGESDTDALPAACRPARSLSAARQVLASAKQVAGLNSILSVALALAGASAHVPRVDAQTHQHEMKALVPGQGDARQLVKFPEPMRLHTITNMSDHLLALQEIDVALAGNDFDKAASIAEHRLGMSSLELHGAAHIAPFMPQGMQNIGTEMHRAASRFAIEAQNASVGDDVRPALAALGAVMQQCVACHASYRLH
jgi:cytochrome c556